MTEWLRASTYTEKSESTTKKLGKSSYLFSTGYSRTTFPEPRFVRARLSLPPNKIKAIKKMIKWMPKNSFLISSPVNFLFQHLEPCCSKTTEWQKRGLPHAHILIWLVERIQPDQIDDIIIMCWDSRSRSRSRPTWCCNIQMWFMDHVAQSIPNHLAWSTGSVKNDIHFFLFTTYPNL